MDVFEKVKKILCDQLDLEEEQVTEEAEVIEDLGADSLDIVDLVMTLEENSTPRFRTRTSKTSKPSATSSNISRTTRHNASSLFQRAGGKRTSAFLLLFVWPLSSHKFKTFY